MMSKLEELALGYAAHEALEDHIYINNYDAYLELHSAVKEGRDPVGMSIWEPLKDMSWSQLLCYVDGQAANASRMFDCIMSDITSGLTVSGVNNDILKSLDVKKIYELGAKNRIIN